MSKRHKNIFFNIKNVFKNVTDANN